MPNHTANNFTITGYKDDVLRFVAQAKGEDSALDFNNVLPMPKDLVGTSSPTRIMSQDDIDKVWAEWNKKKEAKADSGPMGLHSYEEDRPFGLGITQAESARLIGVYGYDNWYDWCIFNWGTKWDCYDVTEWSIHDREDGTMSATIYYETAWSPVTALWMKVSKDYPKCEFYHEFADEGGGFLGSETIMDGRIISEEELDWNSDDGIELREGLGRYWPEDAEDEVEA